MEVPLGKLASKPTLMFAIVSIDTDRQERVGADQGCLAAAVSTVAEVFSFFISVIF